MQARALELVKQGNAAAQKKDGVMSAMLRIALACLPWPEPASAAKAVVAIGVVRHVWANGMVLKSAPDARAPELLHLPRGATVLLLSDAASPVAHRAAATRRGVCVALEGHWREAVAQGRRGWVFDGCLSRYPAPADCSSEDLAYAASVFGIARSGVAESAPRRWKLADHAGAAEIYWTRVSFVASGERMKMAGQGASESMATQGMPLTFNEALLWWLHFQK